MLFSAMDTQQIVLIVLVILLVLVLIIMPIFTNKKRQQSVNTLHNSLKVGDKVMTIGGVIGVVTDIKQTSPVDKEFTIQTGTSTMVFDIKALYQIMPSANSVASEPVGQAAEVKEPVSEVVAPTETTEELAEVKEEVKVEEPEVKEEAASVESETVATVDEKPAEEEKPAAKKTTTSKPRTNSTKKPIKK